MTVSTDNATPPKSTTSINSNSSVQIQIKCISHFEFTPRDTKKSEYPDVVDFGGATSTFSVETVIVKRALSALSEFVGRGIPRNLTARPNQSCMFPHR